MRCSVLQCVAVCCSALQCVAERETWKLSNVYCKSLLLRYDEMQCVVVRCSVLQRDALCCSALQCVAKCDSALHPLLRYDEYQCVQHVAA